MNEINVSQLAKLPKEACEIIDIRDEGSVLYGMIPGAVHITVAELEHNMETYLDKIDKGKKLVIYCQRGQKSVEIAEMLGRYGRECYSLTGGYNAYLQFLIADVATDEEASKLKQEKAENSIRKKFHKQIFSPFAKACKTYELIKEGDRIAVCISGGKDSMLMAKLFQEIKRHRKVNFELTFLVMDPGYNKENRALIARLKETNPYVENNIFKSVENVNLNTIIAYKKDGERHYFLDEY